MKEGYGEGERVSESKPASSFQPCKKESKKGGKEEKLSSGEKLSKLLYRERVNERSIRLRSK